MRDVFHSTYVTSGVRGLLLALIAKAARWPIMLTLQPAQVAHPIRIRLSTTDAIAYEEVFLNKAYEIGPCLSPSVIVDAGANTGMASIYFANRYPNSRIIALEPEPENFKLLQRNTAPYRNIKVVLAALWSSDGFVSLHDPGLGEYGFRVQDQHGSVPAITIGTLISQEGIERIDLLNFDIEGSEKEIFSGRPEWISKVNFAIVEAHDWFRPGCGEAARKALCDFEHWSNGTGMLYFKRRARIS